MKITNELQIVDRINKLWDDSNHILNGTSNSNRRLFGVYYLTPYYMFIELLCKNNDIEVFKYLAEKEIIVINKKLTNFIRQVTLCPDINRYIWDKYGINC